MTNRRRILVGAFGVAVFPLSGCMTKPLRPVNADGTYCFRIGKTYRRTLTCTTEPVPSEAAEEEAKRFEGAAGALTIYVLRKRWADASNRVPVAVDGRARIVTIPASLVRIRLPPGDHQLALEWEGQSLEQRVSGAAGDVRFVELVGSVWSWSSSYHWEDGSLADSRGRAVSAKLIADLDLRG